MRSDDRSIIYPKRLLFSLFLKQNDKNSHSPGIPRGKFLFPGIPRSPGNLKSGENPSPSDHQEKEIVFHFEYPLHSLTCSTSLTDSTSLTRYFSLSELVSLTSSKGLTCFYKLSGFPSLTGSLYCCI